MSTKTPTNLHLHSSKTVAVISTATLALVRQLQYLMTQFQKGTYGQCVYSARSSHRCGDCARSATPSRGSGKRRDLSAISTEVFMDVSSLCGLQWMFQNYANCVCFMAITNGRRKNLVALRFCQVCTILDNLRSRSTPSTERQTYAHGTWRIESSNTTAQQIR